MAKIAEAAEITQKMLDDAVAWYAAHQVPPAFQGLDRRLIAWVQDRGIDWRRCTTDGTTIIVWNVVKWQPEKDD